LERSGERVLAIHRDRAFSYFGGKGEKVPANASELSVKLGRTNLGKKNPFPDADPAFEFNSLWQRHVLIDQQVSAVEAFDDAGNRHTCPAHPHRFKRRGSYDRLTLGEM
jgi:hypothetical protein